MGVFFCARIEDFADSHDSHFRRKCSLSSTRTSILIRKARAARQRLKRIHVPGYKPQPAKFSS